MNIFDIVPGNFFSILASKNKGIYFDCLKIIYDLYDKKMGFDVTKEEVMDELVEYFENNEDYKEDGEQIDTPREKANTALNRLYQTGWISLETDNDYNDLVSFRYYALTILESFEKITSTRDEEETDYAVFEYKGYLFSIYSLLTKSTESDYGLVINQVARLSIEFIGEIKKINLKLRDYITSISQNTGIRELMEKLIDYKTQLIDKSYQRLKTFDNVDRYKRRILEKLEEIYSNTVLINRVVGQYMIDKNATYDEAESMVVKAINDTIDIFNNLDELIEEIEEKNKVYVNSTITKIKFLLNNETDTLGKLNFILKFMTTNHNLTDHQIMNKVDKLFTISQQQAINSDSLYSPRMITKPFTQQPLSDLSRPDLGQLSAVFLQEYDLEYSEPKILAYVDSVLENRESVFASSLFSTTPDNDSLLKLLYVLVYGTTSENYKVEKISQKYETDKFIINDFEIIRR